MIPMPERNSVTEAATVAASVCIRNALGGAYDSVAIGDIGTVVSGSTPSTHDPSYWDGPIVWVTPKDLGRPRSIEVVASERTITTRALGDRTDRLLPVGAVLFSSRAPIGYLGIAGVPLYTNQGCRNIVCDEDLDERYLFHTLRADVPRIRELGRGNTFAEVPAKIVRSWQIPLPPLALQQQVASALDAHYLRTMGDEVRRPPLPSGLEHYDAYLSMLEEVVTLHALNERVRLDLERLIPSLVEKARNLS